VSTKKQRADLLLVSRGMVETRSKAQALIMAGQVFTGEQRVDKAGALLCPDAPLEVRQRRRFVSRGGDKLDGAIEDLADYDLRIAGAACLDVGASTGGFTDCLLSRGAAKVYAVDVGYGQLDPKLRGDERVVVRERTNARDLDANCFAEPIELVVVDASFISIAKLIAPIAAVLAAPRGAAVRAELLALVKPQFEAGKEQAAKNRGVIRDPTIRAAAIASARAAIEGAGFGVVAEVDSRVHGPKGNVERFVYARYER